MKHTLLCQIKSMQKGSEDLRIETLCTFMNLCVQNKVAFWTCAKVPEVLWLINEARSHLSLWVYTCRNVYCIYPNIQEEPNYWKTNQERKKRRKTLIKVAGWFWVGLTWGIWVWKDEKQTLWAQQNGHLSQGKPKPYLKSCNAKEEEDKNPLHSLVLLLAIALRPFQFGLGFPYNWCPFLSIQCFCSPSFHSELP